MAEGIRAHSRLTTLHLADGGFVDNLKQRFGFGGPPESVSEKYARQDRERAARSAAKAPAPAAAPDAAPGSAAARLGGINLDAMKRREDAAGLKHGGTVPKQGGVIRGPGTGRSDSIPARMKPGSFVLPADSTKRLSNVRVSNGEGAFPPEVVRRIGAAALLAMRDVTHKPMAGTRVPQRLEGGGEVEQQRPNSFGDAAAVANDAAVTQVGASPSVPEQATEPASAQSSAPVSETLSRLSDGGGSGGNSFGDAAAASQDSSVRQVGPLPSGGGGGNPGGGGAVFGIYPQTSSTRSTYATDNALRQGVQADGPSSFSPARPAVDPGPMRLDNYTDPRSTQFGQQTGMTGTPSSAPAGSAAGGQQPYSDARNGTGGYDARARMSELPGSGDQAYDLSKGKDVGFGTTRFDGGSSPLFTNVPNAADNASLMGRGEISAKNMQAANNLEQRDIERTRGVLAVDQFNREAADAKAINSQPYYATGGSNGFRRDPGLESQARIANDAANRMRGVDPKSLDRALRQREVDSQQQTATQAEQGRNLRNFADNRISQGRLDLDSKTAGVDARSKLNMQSAQESYLNAQTPEARSTALLRLQGLQGHAPTPKFSVLRGGKDADGNVEPDRAINNLTSEIIQAPRRYPAPPSAALQLLQKTPSLAAKFDEQYGPGAAARYGMK